MLVLLGVGGGVLILPITAIVIASGARRRADELNTELDAIRTQLSSLKQRAESVRDEPVRAEPARPDPAPMPAPPLAPLPPAPAPRSESDSRLYAEQAERERAREAVKKALPKPLTPTPQIPTPPSSVPLIEPAPTFDWERLLGVRGAAIFGGIALALAGLLFFRYSIEHGLIGPGLRVALGIGVGLFSFGIAERLRGRYTFAPAALAGAGVAVLYASFYAASMMYGLMPVQLAFMLMILTTVAASFSALRHDSILVAVLGLVGGFATPLALSTGSNQPIALFTYALLLDAGFVFIAMKKRWSILGVLALFATTVLQLGWVFTRMETSQSALTLGILTVFAIAFTFTAHLAASRNEESTTWAHLRTASIGLAYALAAIVALKAGGSLHFIQLAIFMGALSLMSAWSSRNASNDEDPLPLLSVIAQLVITAAFLVNETASPVQTWELISCFIALAAIPHVFTERYGTDATDRASAVLTGGLLLFTTIELIRWASLGSTLPALVGVTVLTLMAFRLMNLTKRSELAPPVAAALALVVSAYRAVAVAHSADVLNGAEHLLLVTMPAVMALAFHLWARANKDEKARQSGDISTGVFALTSLLGSAWLGLSSPFAISGALLTNACLAIFGLITAPRVHHGGWILATVVCLAIAQGTYSSSAAAPDMDIAFGLMLATAILCTVWPLLLGKTWVADRFATYGAALAIPLHFYSLQALFRSMWGTSFIGVLPLGLAAVLFATMAMSRMTWLIRETEKRGLAWFAGAALSMVCIAIPLQLDRQWITIGWALLGTACLALWKRLNHEGLKWFALALAGTVVVRLVFNPAVLDYEARGAMPILNWLTYTYLIPVICLAAGALLLKPLEVARAQVWERELYQTGQPIGAIFLTMSALLVLFVWVNLSVLDAFGTGSTLSIPTGRMAARDLTLSLSWLVYAVGVLALGMWRKSKLLRWTSLVVMLASIGKVFLYDLGELTDLYRVGSMLGLAVSLIVISIAYQRFVFRKEPALPQPRAQ